MRPEKFPHINSFNASQATNKPTDRGEPHQARLQEGREGQQGFVLPRRLGVPDNPAHRVLQRSHPDLLLPGRGALPELRGPGAAVHADDPGSWKAGPGRSAPGGLRLRRAPPRGPAGRLHGGRRQDRDGAGQRRRGQGQGASSAEQRRGGRRSRLPERQQVIMGSLDPSPGFSVARLRK